MILLNALTINNTALFIQKSASKIKLNEQNLGTNESIIFWHTNGNTGQFDANN